MRLLVTAGPTREYLDDVRYLLRYLDITNADDALAIVVRYFDGEKLLPKTRLVLEELLGEK